MGKKKVISVIAFVAIAMVSGCTQTEAHQHGLCGIEGCVQIGEHSHGRCDIAGCTETQAHMHNGEYCYPHSADDGHHQFGHGGRYR